MERGAQIPQIASAEAPQNPSRLRIEMLKHALECEVFAFSLFKRNVWCVKLYVSVLRTPLPAPRLLGTRPKVLKSPWQP